jgi:hypothetical protein
VDKATKLVEQWKTAVPGQVSWEDVKLVLNAHFPTWRYAKGSHVIVSSELMRKIISEKGYANHLLPFNYKGEFDLVVHGNNVSKLHLKTLLRAIEIFDVLRDLG